MAEAIVVPAVISVLFSPLVEKLISKALATLGSSSKDAKERRDLEEQLKFLDLKVKLVRDYLEDAESKQFKSPAVRTWLSELKDIVYDVEDLLDEYVTDVALLQIRKDIPQKKKSFMDRIFKSRSSSSADPAVSFEINCDSVLDHIKDINNKFKRLDEMKDQLGLRKLDSHVQSLQQNPRGHESTSFLDPHIFGRDDVKEQIVKLLTSDEVERRGTELPVLPIVGMGGVGKTTLAQLVFHDDNVGKHFNLRIWVWISQNFDPLNILRRIIGDIEENPCSLESLQELHKKIQKTIENRKFLLVLDDAWNEEDYHLWEDVLRPFRVGSKGSSVIVTTRSHRVAKSIIGHMDPINLGGLDDERIWNVLENCAFGGPADPNKHLHLIEIGKQMVKKLKGSPLAAKAIGRLLNTDLRINHWKRILSSEIWELDGKSEHGILPSLMLSYQNLSPSLRQCFKLCSLFPKGCQFVRKEGDSIVSYDMLKLHYIWMAHGIFQDKFDRTPEDCARDAVNDLQSMSLFQEDEDGDVTMHDLIHSVSEYVSQDDHLCITNGVAPRKYPSKVRHVSLSCSMDIPNLDTKLLEFPCKYEKLRTLIIRDSMRLLCFDKVLKELLERSSCLRVLELSQCPIWELPDSICNQKHLRYLDISSTYIVELPESLTNLYNLQALILNGCKLLTAVPDTIGNLIHLRYLGLSGTPISELPDSLTSLNNLQVLEADCQNLSRLPNGTTNLVNLRILKANSDLIHTLEGIGRMTSLQELRKFRVESTCDWGIEQLENLDMLKRRLQIESLENVAGDAEAKKANLQRKVYLEKLRLEWSEDSKVDSQVAERVLEALQPSGNHLKRLTIKGYRGRGFPSWLADGSHYQNLKSIKLINWENCLDVEIKFPLSLSHMAIRGFRSSVNLALQHIPTSLKRLYIRESGIDDESLKACLCCLTNLRLLSLRDCPKLSEPLEKEVIIGCMEKSLTKLRLGVGNWGFYFDIDKIYGSGWKLEIEQLEDSFQEATSTRRWAWELLLGIASRVYRLEIRHCGIESMDVLKELFLVMTTLHELSVERCNQLLSLPTYFAEVTTLQYLRLFECRRIQSLPDAALPSSPRALDGNEVAVLHPKPSDKDGIPRLTSLPASLQRLCIESCESLASLPSDMRGCTSLKELQLEKCLKMESMSHVRLPSSLEELSIKFCENLASLPSNMRGLKKLELYACSSLQSTSDVSPLPASLESIFLDECESLALLPSDMRGLTSLKKLQLHNCQKIESMSDICLPASLEELSINDCGSLASLPSDMRELTSLRSLQLEKCLKMESMLDVHLPSSLEELTIKYCENLAALPLDMRGLTALKVLRLWVCLNMQSKSDVLLPASLKELRIAVCENLRSLPSNMRGMKSLQWLALGGCPNIRSFPKSGLPASLRLLTIVRCPALKERYCRERGGPDWDFLSPVPNIRWG